MQSTILIYKSSFISYFRYGSGPVAVFCFHGYSENASRFAFLDESARTEFSLLCVDLPFHGKTEWNEKNGLAPADLSRIINLIAAAEKLQEPYRIIGYSMGGRIALTLYQLMPARIDKVVLLAPDGLKMNPWYWFVTQTLAGNRAFRFTVNNPSWFFGLLKVLNRLRVVNSTIFKFIAYYIGDAAVRRALYQRWMCLRDITPDLGSIRRSVSKYRASFHLIYGNDDRIILPGPGKKFCRKLGDNCNIQILDAGHFLLQDKYIPTIMEALRR